MDALLYNQHPNRMGPSAVFQVSDIDEIPASEETIAAACRQIYSPGHIREVECEQFTGVWSSTLRHLGNVVVG